MIDGINLTDHDLLIRIDERAGNIEEQLATLNGKIIEHEEELHNQGGVYDRLSVTEERQKNNRTLIFSLWGVIVLIHGAVVDLFVGHLRGS